MTTIHTRQLQQYTQDNYNNTHKATNNNTQKTTTTIHKDNYKNTHNYNNTQRLLQQYTQDN